VTGATSKPRRFQEVFGLGFTQAEVDFVIPDLNTDLPLCIDPFLLYKSKDPSLLELHQRLLSIFAQGVEFYRLGRRADLDRLITFPEVNEVGLGYSEGQIRGSGLGVQLNRLLADTLAASPALQERGLRHVEELQLVAIGVGADRISDITANVLKAYLIEYTQRQAGIWKIPLTSTLPVAHVFDFEGWEWSDGYFDLPLNPVSNRPILLVPRRIVRLLPWINYDDYFRSDFRLFLNPSTRSKMPRYPGMPQRERVAVAKTEVVKLTRENTTVLNQYIGRKERQANLAQPALTQDLESDPREAGEALIGRLQAIPTGQPAAAVYQQAVFEIINYLFEPELTDGGMEVKTYLGTERRDIVYTNEAESSFWGFVRDRYNGLFLMFEVKNTSNLELDHINQTAAYLGVRIGMLGYIITRTRPGDNIIRKTYSVFNDTPGIPRKTVLILSDEDLISMIRLKQGGNSPVKYVQRHYQEFHKRIQ
jgi:hypothetical protein